MEKQFPFTFPESLKDRVKKAKPEHESIAEFIRRAIENLLKDYEN